jgi:hypothetical protein
MKKMMRYFVLVILLGWSVGIDAQSEVEWVVEPTLEFDEISFFYEKSIIVFMKSNKYGFMDYKGQLLTDVMFDDISSSNPLFNEGYGLEYLMSWINDDLIAVNKDDKWGFINIKGKQITSFNFDEVGFFKEGLAAVKRNDKWGFINTKGKLITDFKFDEVQSFREGLAAVKRNDKWGFIDTNGKLITNFEFDTFSTFYNGFSGVRKGDKWGFINTKGKQTTSFNFDEVYSFTDSFAAVKRNGKWSFINRKGKLITDLEFDKVMFFKEGFTGVRKNGKWGFINTNGKLITDLEFDKVQSFSEGFAKVRKGDKWSFININGELITDLEFDAIYDFSHHFFRVVKDGKSGIIDNRGNLLIGTVYNAIYSFSEGFAAAHKDNTWEYIDIDGNTIINNLEVEYAFPFRGGFTNLKKSKNESFYIDKSGKMITDFGYKINSINSNFIWVENNNNKSGLINHSGKIIIPIIFDEVKFSSINEKWVKLNNKWGIIRHPYYNKQPKINFPNLNQTINLTDAIKLNFKVCIQSSSDVKETTLFINGKEYGRRGLGKGKDSDVCAKIYEYSIPVTGKGEYKIKVVSSNEYGTTTETRLVQVIKNYNKAVKIPKAKNHAVFIGINDYTYWKDLKTPVNDCKALIKVLTENYNFEADNIHTFYNEKADGDVILGFLGQLTEKLGKNDNLLVYYAGHGYYSERYDGGYWIPYNAPKIMNEFAFIQDSDIKKILCTSDIRNVYVIADACYSGSFFDDDRHEVRTDPFTDDMDNFLQQKTSFRGFASGGIETVADVSANNPDHSPFADALITLLKEYPYPALPAMILENHVLFKVQPSTTQTPKADYVKACEDSRGENVGQFVFYRVIK